MSLKCHYSGGMSDDASLPPVNAGGMPVEGDLPPGRAFAAEQPSTAPRFFAALGNPWRWKMVKMLADGRALTATDVAGVLKRDFDGVSKHLRILRAAGVVQSRRGKDRRLELFFIPQSNRPEAGILEWGMVRLDIRPR
jgi:DNA-binding transcriptional ArsR family regulator